VVHPEFSVFGFQFSVFREVKHQDHEGHEEEGEERLTCTAHLVALALFVFGNERRTFSAFLAPSAKGI
jgi:hypothetical protein